jgi:hypothetical protein
MKPADDNLSATAEKRAGATRAARAGQTLSPSRSFCASGFLPPALVPDTVRGRVTETLQTVPIIFTPPVERQTLSWGGRLIALTVALAALAALVAGMLLQPSPQGTGTHLQMGFQRCQFLRTTNLPCPSCGMTTSFSWFSKGNWLASLYVQPGGFLLALTCGALFWAGLYAFITASPLQRLIRQVPGIYSVPIILGFFIAAWGWKIFIHLKGIDGWG